MMIPDWLLPTIALLPALLWMFLGVGIPWALAVLPRYRWHDRVMVVGLALALGPALTTTAMFLIGTFGHFTLANVLVGSAVAAGIGLLLAWRNHSPRTGPAVLPRQPLSALEIVIAVLLVLVMVVRFWNAAYWPYTTYDEFWVYGYNAKIFMLHGSIPTTMGYYPQLLPLAFTYGQLMWGGLNDHAARTVVPYFALASLFMAYLLGARLFNRRVGFLAAEIWMFYPQHAAWTQFGDLEVPVTMYFTATAFFFALGWRERSKRTLITAGLLMGAALWTKPTAAALVESAILIVGVGLLLRAVGWQRDAKRLYWKLSNQPRPEILRRGWRAVRYPLLVLLVAVPMGGMWYIRNVLYGLPPLVLPASYWQNAAQRSGQELGWPLLIALLAAVIIRRRVAFVGLALFAVGSLPSAFGWRVPTFDELRTMVVGGTPTTITPTHLTILEWIVIAAGSALLIWAAIPAWRRLSFSIRHAVAIIVAFIIPYFVTWFWSYSYHFRLSFAIVPALIVLLAALLDRLLSRSVAIPRSVAYVRLRSAALCVIVLALALPGLYASASGLEFAITGGLANDHDKIALGNQALMGLVDYLQDRKNPNHYPAVIDHPLRVAAPGELRLPFFFPLDDIRTDSYPTTLDQIADVDFFVDSSVGQRLYIENGKSYNQILSSLTRENAMRRVYTTDDHNFRFSIYTVDNQGRFLPPTPNGPLDAQIGDFAYLNGYDLSTNKGGPGGNIYLTLWWQALGPANLDYSVFIHLVDPQNQNVAASVSGGEPVSGAFSVWDHVPGTHFSDPYHTRLWQKGETVKDEWKFPLPDIPPGIYQMRVGLFDPVSGLRLPVEKNGQAAGDSVLLLNFTILPKPK